MSQASRGSSILVGWRGSLHRERCEKKAKCMVIIRLPLRSSPHTRPSEVRRRSLPVDFLSSSFSRTYQPPHLVERSFRHVDAALIVCIIIGIMRRIILRERPNRITTEHARTHYPGRVEEEEETASRRRASTTAITSLLLATKIVVFCQAIPSFPVTEEFSR